MPSNTCRVAVIGGGAAGYFSAIQIKDHNPECSVTLFEGTTKVLSKVLISGGGRCNVTNYTPEVRELVKNYPRGEKELIGPFNQFGPLDTINWFESRGVILKTEADKRVFPVTDTSESIAHVLTESAQKCGVRILKSKRVDTIEPKKPHGYRLYFKDHFTEEYDKVVVASGGIKESGSLFSKLEHTLVSPVPSLFTFQIKDPLIDGLSGASVKQVDAHVRFDMKSKKFVSNRKPLLITHWGLSGPAIIVLSAHYARELFETSYKADLIVNFTPYNKISEVSEVLISMKSQFPKKRLSSVRLFDLPQSLWERFIEVSKIPTELTFSNLSLKQADLLSRHLTSYTFQVQGKGQFKEEFVTAGGVSLKEVDFKTMQSKIYPGLYFCGEVLDIDGVTGGFNFQAAWTTAYIAGKSLNSEP